MRFEAAYELVTDYALEMLDAPQGGLLAVGVAAKGGGPIAGASDFAVTAFVREKLPATVLERGGIVTFHEVFSASTGIPINRRLDLEVIETGGDFTPLPALIVPAAQRGLYGGSPAKTDTQKRFNSLRIGIGVTNPMREYPLHFSVGTAGFYLIDQAGTIYLVSNNHVLAQSNAGNVGDCIVQPGTLDLTAAELMANPTLPLLESNFKIGELLGWKPLVYRTQANIPTNTVDLAVATLDATRRGLTEVDRVAYGGGIIGTAPPFVLSPTQQIQGSVRVHKCGRSTGHTEGEVTAIAVTATIPYSSPSTGAAHRAYFVDQIAIQPTAENGGPYSGAGDSGSAILNDHHELVGLLFAGSPKQTLANPITNVMIELQAIMSHNLVTTWRVHTL